MISEEKIKDVFDCWMKNKECKALAVNGGFCRFYMLCKYFDEAYDEGYNKALRIMMMKDKIY